MKMENQFLFLEYYGDDNDTYEEFAKKELYYDYNKKKWVTKEEYTGYWYPSTFPCCSYKAAKRHLRNHNEIPKGTKFKLSNRLVGFDRWLIKR